MKKIFTGAIFFLVIAGCTNMNDLKPTISSGTQIITPASQNEIPSTQILTAPAKTEGQTMQVYRYKPYNFQFNYPANFIFTSPNYANLEDKIVQLEIPKDIFPKTNFVDAGFTVSAATATTLEQCLSLSPPEGSNGFLTSVTSNGIKFYESKGSGAGAGNFYESKIYRTFNKSTCLEILETVHTANIGNFTPGEVTEVDKKQAWEKLQEIFSTFTFNS